MNTGTAGRMSAGDRRRWYGLAVQCLGVLMIMLDSTIVNVALPSIKIDLRFSESSLVWVVNGYMIPFAGFLLVGGRLGDCYGHRRVFQLGVGLFTCASLACGIAGVAGLLVSARIVQGLAGAMVSAVSLSSILSQFEESRARARALSIYSFASAGGGSAGLVLGGLLTSQLNWRWIFLVNIPIGVLVCALCRILLPTQQPRARRIELDIPGALTATLGAMLLVYAILQAPAVGWSSWSVILGLSGAVVLLLVFLFVEMRAPEPLVRPTLLRERNLAVATAVGMLWAAASYLWFFVMPFYLQGILNYDSFQVGLAFLPATLTMAVFALGLSMRIAMRVGVRSALTLGLALLCAGLFLFARLPLQASFWMDLLPGMLLIGLGSGIAYNPLLLGASSGVGQEEYGVAAGIVTSAITIGGALGLAFLAGIASFRTQHVLAMQLSLPAALNAGYQLVLSISALLAAAAAICSAVFFSSRMGLEGEPSAAVR